VRPTTAKFSALAVFLIAALSSVAQELPDSPQPRFWTPTQITLSALDAGAKAADYYYTHQTSLQPNPVETNFLYRPFIGRGAATAASFFVGLWCADQIESYLLYRFTARHQKRRWLRFAPIVYGISANAQGAYFSATHQFLKPKDSQ